LTRAFLDSAALPDAGNQALEYSNDKASPFRRQPSRPRIHPESNQRFQVSKVEKVPLLWALQWQCTLSQAALESPRWSTWSGGSKPPCSPTSERDEWARSAHSQRHLPSSRRAAEGRPCGRPPWPARPASCWGTAAWCPGSGASPPCAPGTCTASARPALDPHHPPVVAVAPRAYGHVELEVLVAVVRLRLAQVPLDAGAAQHDAAEKARCPLHRGKN